MSHKQLVANELLAFLQNKLSVMDEVSIAHIVKSSFSEDKIKTAKLLLFQSLNKTDQMPSRRKDDKGERSLQDIITILKETDPDDVPEFVARGEELHNLPPVSFDHVDVTRLLKDITSLRSSLAELQIKFEASQNTISELRSEVTMLQNINALHSSPMTSNINARRGAQNASLCSFESAKLDASSPAAGLGNVSESPRPAARSSPPQEGPPRAGTCASPARAYATVAAAAAKQPVRAAKGRTSGPSKSLCDKEGFTVVERKKKKPSSNRCGTAPTGPNHLLRPAIPTTHLYVSRVHFTTKAEDVTQYVSKKANICPRVMQLESRHAVSFNSFVVRIPTEKLSTFMNEEFWPKGVVFRRFRGRIPSSQVPRVTLPTTQR